MKKLLGKICILSVCVFLVVINNLSAQTLEDGFKNPPMINRPYVWWPWMGANFSLSGIKKDLEAMKECGIGGATIFNLTSMVRWTCFPTDNVPWPNQTYRSEAYWNALRYACSEAQNLGIELGIHNTPGYSTTGGPWISEERNMKDIRVRRVDVTGGEKPIVMNIAVPDIPPFDGFGVVQKDYMPKFHDIAVIAISNDDVIGEKQIDVTKNMKSNGDFVWKAPVGKWAIYRIGYAATMSTPHPVPDEIMGKTREVDKLNADDNIYHWDQVLIPMQEHIGDYFGKSLRHVLIDSYEAGEQTWSLNFRDDFKKLKGYDPVPYIPYLYVGKDQHLNIDTVKLQRFEWDYNDVISYLFQENGWKIGKEKIASYGLKLQQEPYWGPYSIVAGAALDDLPMGEFWSTGEGEVDVNVPAGARAAAHSVIGAEAYSAQPEVSCWTEDPAMLKKATEGAFIAGINHFCFHQWVLQPFDDKYQPGMTMGWWGSHFSRFQPWFKPGFAFFHYLGRCQYLLQQGQQVIDFLALDAVKDKITDAIATPDFLRDAVIVKEGHIILSSGRIYKDMEFDTSKGMLPQVIDKVAFLLSKGAVIVAKKPVQSPSMSNYPQCDEYVKNKANQLWEKYENVQIFSTRAEAVKTLHLEPDYIAVAGTPNVLHRHTGDTEIYLITNMTAKAQEMKVSLRCYGLLPELWNAEKATIDIVPNWYYQNHRTVVSISLQPYQSRFVILRKKSTIVDEKLGKTALPIYKKCNSLALSDNWNIYFKPKLDKAFDYQMNHLIDFSNSTDKRIKYFAGTAIYKKVITLSKKELKGIAKIWLELGEMNDIATLEINDIQADTLWYEPYRPEITKYLHKGKNTITLSVSVNWPNKLIGDEQYPADFELGVADENPLRGRNLQKYPDWFLNNKPRPEQHRKTFTTWHYYTKDSSLQKAGLVGPVKIEFYKIVK